MNQRNIRFIREDYVRYKSLDNYKWNNEIDKVLFDDLKVILDNLSISNVEQADLSRPWSSEFQFIPQYKIDNVGKNVCADTETQWLVVDSITQQQRVVFYAVCKFFKEGAANSEFENENLKR